MPFSDYIIFVDESGTPNLGTVDPTFPVFTLAFVLVEKSEYMHAIVPTIQSLKFKYCGHDQIILHERDIRRQSNQFAFLQVSQALREQFVSDISETLKNLSFEILTCTIDKNALKARYSDPFDPYEIAMFLGMEMCLDALLAKKQTGKTIHTIFEGRGKPEDLNLELAFRRVINNDSHWGYKSKDFKLIDWDVLFLDKRCNSSGLQLADLIARPIALNYLRKQQKNRAYDIISEKIIAQKSFP